MRIGKRKASSRENASYGERGMRMSDNTEQYERKSVLDDFKKVIRESAVYWKSRPDEVFMDAMAKKMLEYIGPYKDILQDAIRHSVENYSSFPSIADLQKCVDLVKQKPKKHLDHIALGSIDSRQKGCDDCEGKGGYVRMIKGEQDLMSFCTCSLGQQLETQHAGKGIVNKEILAKQGFVTFKKWRERK